MAKTILLNTRTSTFLDLLGNGKRFKVPAYQRDYSWEEEQWEDLWNDILELRGDDDSHYMGALVLQGETDREFAIIDGQQRLATLSIAALAIIARISALAAAGIEPESNKERAAALRGRFRLRQQTKFTSTSCDLAGCYSSTRHGNDPEPDGSMRNPHR